ncbi:MAG: hypothetical protein U0939_23955 [Pirellulales bacterium]
MRNKLPRFPVALAGLAFLAIGSFVALRFLGQSNSSHLELTSYNTPDSAGPAVGDEATEVDAAQPTPGSRLLAESARHILAMPSLECKIRQHVALFGQDISGVGSYKQWSPDDVERVRVRWELKFQVGEEAASLQQVNDGRFFWTRRDLPGNQALTRVDLRTVRDLVKREQQRLTPDAILRGWIALGGLSRLVDGLNRHFEFGLAHPRVVDSTPVWVLAGSWRREVLGILVPETQGFLQQNKPVPLERFPGHLPDLVVVVLSRDPRLPAFPYRIEYRRSVEGFVRGTQAEEVTQTQSTAEIIPLESLKRTAELAVIDLYEVSLDSNLGPDDFLFQPPSRQQAVDETDQFVLRTYTPSQSDGK